MRKFQVKKIYRRHENDIESNIEYIGGLNSNGTQWKITVEQAIEAINSNLYDFYVIIDDQEFSIKVDNSNLFLSIDKSISLNLNSLNF